MWKVITSSNLNSPLKLFFYSPILTNNNLLLKIYCENIMITFLNYNFLFIILFLLSQPSFHPYIFFSFFFSSTRCPSLSLSPFFYLIPAPFLFYLLPHLDEVVSSHSLLALSLSYFFFFLLGSSALILSLSLFFFFLQYSLSLSLSLSLSYLSPLSFFPFFLLQRSLSLFFFFFLIPERGITVKLH